MTKVRPIGFIGLGRMGLPMALNLIRRGYPLTVHDLSREAVQAAVKADARAADSCAEAAQCGTVITMLPADPQILSVYLGKDGILERAPEGTLCIDMTSARGATLRRVENTARESGKNIRFLDAPVSGGVPAAENGTLTIMAGGEQPDFKEAKPILETLGKKIFYTGRLGSGKDVKMVNQALNAGNTCVMAEAVYLAGTMGLDPELLFRVVSESSGNSWVFQNNLRKCILAEDFSRGFKLELMRKDLGLCIQQAREDETELPLLQRAYQAYDAMYEQGCGTENYNVVYRWVEQQNT